MSHGQSPEVMAAKLDHKAMEHETPTLTEELPKKGRTININKHFYVTRKGEKNQGTCVHFMPVSFKTKIRMLFSCASPQISKDIKLLDKLRATRAGNCSQMVLTSCKKIRTHMRSKTEIKQHLIIVNYKEELETIRMQ